MRLLAIGFTVWTVTQVNPAGAQNFDERFSIVPKANASEPDAENQPVPQTEPTSVPQTQPLNEARSRSGPEDRSTTRSSKRRFTARAAYHSYRRTGKTAAHARKASEPRVRLTVRVPVVSPTPWDYNIVPRSLSTSRRPRRSIRPARSAGCELWASRCNGARFRRYRLSSSFSPFPVASQSSSHSAAL
jgi:hypothetical protein